MFNLSEKELSSYYAHSKKDSPPESFVLHSEITLKYYDKIIDLYGLDSVFSRLIEDINLNDTSAKNTAIRADIIKKALRDFVAFHDLGKLDKEVQEKFTGKENKSTHSDKSYFIILYKLLVMQKQNTLNGKEFICLFLLLYSVYKHHGRLDDIIEDLEKIGCRFDRDRTIAILTALNEPIDEDALGLPGNKNFWTRWKGENEKRLIRMLSSQSLSFFTLFKLQHSLLITSDYYATMEFTTGRDFKIHTLDMETTNEISRRFHGDTMSGDNFNPRINLDRDIHISKNLNDIASENKGEALNELRSLLNVYAEERVAKFLDEKNDNYVCFLPVPTGGGKTNISLRLALKIMEKRDEIRKLFYVFPFINLIEQSYDYLEKFIGKDHMARLDSGNIELSESHEEREGVAKYVDNLFFNYPILFISHVRFFDLFLRNEKNSNYNFHQLANSIVIIDEIQAYSVTVWTEISCLLNATGRFMNTRFIIMSATLPAIDILSESRFPALFNNRFTEALYNHELFKRTSIKAEKSLKMADKKDKQSIVKFTDKLLKKGTGHSKILVVLNTVKDSLEIYSAICESKVYKKEFNGYELLLLNSTILDDRRKRIIETCKQSDAKAILISTQSVEAGVDIDFDIGFRAYAPFDSIVQVAGRINRNNKKNMGELIVFKDEKYKYVYRDDFRAKATRSMEDDFFKKTEPVNERNEIIGFYDRIIEEVKNDNETPFKESSRSNVSDMANLFFKQVDKNVALIEGDTIALFIPADIEASSYGEFVYKEFMSNGYISGEKVWLAYESLFLEGGYSYETMTVVRNFSKLLCPFTINLFNSRTESGKLKDVLKGGMRYGYFYCRNYEKYYNKKSGLDPDKFKKEVTGREYLIL